MKLQSKPIICAIITVFVLGVGRTAPNFDPNLSFLAASTALREVAKKMIKEDGIEVLTQMVFPNSADEYLKGDFVIATKGGDQVGFNPTGFIGVYKPPAQTGRKIADIDENNWGCSVLVPQSEKMNLFTARVKGCALLIMRLRSAQNVSFMFLAHLYNTPEKPNGLEFQMKEIISELNRRGFEPLEVIFSPQKQSQNYKAALSLLEEQFPVKPRVVLRETKYQFVSDCGFVTPEGWSIFSDNGEEIKTELWGSSTRSQPDYLIDPVARINSDRSLQLNLEEVSSFSLRTSVFNKSRTKAYLAVGPHLLEMDAKTGRPIRRIEFSSQILSLALFPNEKVLAVGLDGGRVKLVNLETGNIAQEKSFPIHPDYILISPKGLQMYIGRTGGLFQIVSPFFEIVSTHLSLFDRTGNPLIKGYLLAISQDESILATGSFAGKIMLWDAKTGQLLRQLCGHSSVINSLSFNQDGSKLLAGCADKTVSLWDLRSGAKIDTIYTGEVIVETFFGPAENSIMTLDRTGILRTFQLGDSEESKYRSFSSNQFTESAV